MAASLGRRTVPPSDMGACADQPRMRVRQRRARNRGAAATAPPRALRPAYVRPAFWPCVAPCAVGTTRSLPYTMSSGAPLSFSRSRPEGPGESGGQGRGSFPCPGPYGNRRRSAPRSPLGHMARGQHSSLRCQVQVFPRRAAPDTRATSHLSGLAIWGTEEPPPPRTAQTTFGRRDGTGRPLWRHPSSISGSSRPVAAFGVRSAIAPEPSAEQFSSIRQLYTASLKACIEPSP